MIRLPTDTTTVHLDANRVEGHFVNHPFDGSQAGNNAAMNLETFSNVIQVEERQSRNQHMPDLSPTDSLDTKLLSTLNSFSANNFSITPRTWRTLNNLSKPKQNADGTALTHPEKFNSIWTDVKNLTEKSGTVKSMLLKRFMQTQEQLIKGSDDFVRGYDFYLRKNQESVLATGDFFRHPEVENFFPGSTEKQFQATDVEDISDIQTKALKAYSALLLRLVEGYPIDYTQLGMVFAHIDMAFSINLEKTKVIPAGTIRERLSDIRASGNKANEIKNAEKQIDAMTGETDFCTFTPFAQHSLYQFTGGSHPRGDGFCHFLSHRFLEKLGEIESMNGLSSKEKSHLKIVAIQSFKITLQILEDTAVKNPASMMGLTQQLFEQNAIHDERTRFTYDNLCSFRQNCVESFANKITNSKEGEYRIRITSDFMGFVGHILSVSVLTVNGRKVYAYFDVNMGLALVHSKEELKACLTKTCEVMTPKQELEKSGIGNYRFQLIDAQPKRLAKVKAIEKNEFLSLSELESICLEGKLIEPLTEQDRYSHYSKNGSSAVPKIITRPNPCPKDFGAAHNFKSFNEWREKVLQATEKKHGDK